MMIYCFPTYLYEAVHANRVATLMTMVCCHARNRDPARARGRFLVSRSD
jgi:hypothetical protein